MKYTYLKSPKGNYDGRVSKIASFGSRDTLFSEISFAYPDKHGENITLVSSDGRQVLYNYDRKCLKSVIRNHGPTIEYEYNGRKKLIKKSLPNNRYLQVQYYKNGDNQLGNETVNIQGGDDSKLLSNKTEQS